MDQNSYRNIISGAIGGACKRFLRWLLRGISIMYKSVIAVRNFGYDKGLLKSYRAEVPVISVGNITTGGTGKTPLVIRLCNLLAEKSLKCVILTRGYRAGQEKLTDEPAILIKSCPDAKVVVNPDRVAAAKALTDSDADVIILDDGFQHRRLRRDIDIITIDATCPFGYGRMLPAGLLRETPQAMKRADAVVITRCERLSDESQKLLEERIRKIAPDIIMAKAIHKNSAPRTIKDRVIDIDEIEGKNAFAFCGIGNPDAFLANISEIGVELVGWRIFNDHHGYSEQDIKDIHGQAGSLKTDIILTTRKDWVKIALVAEKYSDIIWAYLPVKLEFLDGYDRIAGLIEKTIAKSNV